MADSILTNLVEATTLAGANLIYIVQGGVSKKITATNFFKNIPVNPVITEASEAPVSGALSVSLRRSKVTPAASPTNYTLGAGTHGTRKNIVCATFTSGTAVVTVTGGAGFTTLTFNAVGDSVVLENIDGTWFVAGNNSVTVA